MTATISRKRDNAQGQPSVVKKDTDNGSGPAPAEKSGPENNLLGGLKFTVVKGTVAEPKRGGAGRTPIEVPAEFKQAYTDLLNANGTTDTHKVGPITMTNGQIQQLLVLGVKKLNNANPKGEYVKTTITTVDNSPNKRSNDAADKDKGVTIEFSFRYRNEDEQKAYVKAQNDRALRRAAN